MCFSNLNDCHICVERDEAPFVPEDVHHPALIFTVIKHTQFQQNFPLSNGSRFDFRKADLHRLYGELAATDWSFMDRIVDVNVAVAEFYQHLYRIINLYVPSTQFKCNKYPRWFTPAIKRNIKCKMKSYRKWRATGSNFHRREYCRLRSLIKDQISVAYSSYNREIELNIRSQPRIFWDYVRSKKGGTRLPAQMVIDGQQCSDPQVIVDSFASGFEACFRPGVSARVSDEYSNFPVINVGAVSERDIIAAINKLKNSNSVGDDKIPVFFDQGLETHIGSAAQANF